MKIIAIYTTARVSERIGVGKLRKCCEILDNLLDCSVKSGRIWEGGAHEVNFEDVTMTDVEKIRELLADREAEAGSGIPIDMLQRIVEHFDRWMMRYEGERGAENLAFMQLSYERKLKRPIAEKLTLPLQVDIPSDAPTEVKVLVTSHLKSLAEKIAGEIDVHHDRHGITINFGMPWADREEFLQLLWKEHGDHKGWRGFIDHVDQARAAFIDAVELPDEVVA